MPKLSRYLLFESFWTVSNHFESYWILPIVSCVLQRAAICCIVGLTHQILCAKLEAWHSLLAFQLKSPFSAKFPRSRPLLSCEFVCISLISPFCSSLSCSYDWLSAAQRTNAAEVFLLVLIWSQRRQPVSLQGQAGSIWERMYSQTERERDEADWRHFWFYIWRFASSSSPLATRAQFAFSRIVGNFKTF